MPLGRKHVGPCVRSNYDLACMSLLTVRQPGWLPSRAVVRDTTTPSVSNLPESACLPEPACLNFERCHSRSLPQDRSLTACAHLPLLPLPYVRQRWLLRRVWVSDSGVCEQQATVIGEIAPPATVSGLPWQGLY